MHSIILASQSPRRKKLLEQINLTFSIQSSSTDESFDDNTQAEDVVQILAARKAADVASSVTKDSMIIGADTIVSFHEEVLEKPVTSSDAIEMLTSLSGNTHQVLTGVALLKTDLQGNISASCTFFELTHVTFGTLTYDEIETYVKSGSPMDKAGAYGIQDDWGALFVERIEGDYNNVVGFPLYRFYQTMKKFAPEYLPDALN